MAGLWSCRYAHYHIRGYEAGTTLWVNLALTKIIILNNFLYSLSSKEHRLQTGHGNGALLLYIFKQISIIKHQWFSGKIRRCHQFSFDGPRVRFTADAHSMNSLFLIFGNMQKWFLSISILHPFVWILSEEKTIQFHGLIDLI